MGIYTKGGSINAVISDTSVTRGRYTTDSALRVTPVSGSTFTGETAPDGSVNVTNYDGLRGLYHPSGAIRGFFSNSETAISGLYHRSGALNLYASVSNATLELIGESNGLSLNFLDNSSDIVTSGVSAKSTATGTIAFTRASLATVTDSDGKIKWAPHNLLLASEQFDAANWTKTATVVTANTAAAPNGTTTADTLREDGTNTFHTLVQSLTLPVGLVTHRIYAKLGSGTRFLQIRPAGLGTGVAFANFNLSTGAVVAGGTGGSAFVSASVTPSENGFFLCEMVANYASSPTGMNFALSNATTENPAYTGDNTSSIVIWGAHLYRSDLGGMQANASAYPMYNPSTTAAAAHGPRLDYNGSTLAPLGLLVEEQRTNLFLHSNTFSDAAWTKAGVSITSGAGTGLDGANSASKLVEAAAGGTHILFQTRTATASAAHSASLFIKAAERSRVLFQLDDGSANGAQGSFNLSAGTAAAPTVFGTGSAATSTIENFGNGWYRCTLRCIPATTGSSVRLIVYLLDNSGVASYTGNGTSGVLISNSQLEAGNFQTSYIPTAASTVTRSADIASVSTSQFPYSATEGTLVCTVSRQSAGVVVRSLSISDGTLTNVTWLVTGLVNQVGYMITGGTNQVAMGAAVTTTGIHKLGLAFANNDVALSQNGGAVTTDTTATLPSGITTLHIGHLPTPFPGTGHIRQITYIPRRLTNAELQARTTL